MIKIPYFIFIAIAAFNMTAFAFVLQADFLGSHSIVAKSIAWLVTAVTWIIAYAYRNRFYVLRIR